MAVENFIPTIWAAGINKALDKKLVYASLANRNYQGTISGPGDSVRINEIGPLSVSDYTKNSTSITFSALSDASKTLLIDQVKYGAFYVDDVDRAMATPGFAEEGQRKLAYAFADAIDQYVASLYSEAGTYNNLGTTGTPITCSSGTILSRVAQMDKELSDNNVPSDGRWMVVPPWFIKNLHLAGLTSAISPNADMLQNGYSGKLLGFNLYVSNNVPHSSTTYYVIMAGTMDAITFAGKLQNIEVLRLTAQYGDGVRGLYIYGGKVVVNDALGTLIVTE